MTKLSEKFLSFRSSYDCRHFLRCPANDRLSPAFNTPTRPNLIHSAMSSAIDAYGQFVPELVAANRPLLAVTGLLPASPADTASPVPVPDAASHDDAALYFSAVRQKLLGIFTGKRADDETEPRMATAIVPRDHAFGWRAELGNGGRPRSPQLVDVPLSGGLAPSGKPLSPLSPRNPASPLYPDGLISPKWLQRYRLHTPCAVLYVAEVREDPRSQSGQPIGVGSPSASSPMPAAVRISVSEHENPLLDIPDLPPIAMTGGSPALPPPPVGQSPQPWLAGSRPSPPPTSTEVSADSLLIAEINAYKGTLPPGTKVFPLLLSRLDHIHAQHPRVDRIRRETSSEHVWVLNALIGIPGTSASPNPSVEFGFVDAAAFVAEIHSYLLLQSPTLREYYVDLKARAVRKKRAKLRPPPPGGVDDGPPSPLGALAQIIRLEYKQATFLSFASYGLPAEHPTRQDAVRAYESCLSYIHEYVANSLGTDAARARTFGNACSIDGLRWRELVELADSVAFHLIRGLMVAAAAPNASGDALAKPIAAYRSQYTILSTLPEFGWDIVPPAGQEGRELVPPGALLPRGGGTPLFWAWLSKYPPLFSTILASLPALSRTIDSKYLPQPPGPMSAREAITAIGEVVGKTFGPGMGGWGWWDSLGASMVEMRGRRAFEGLKWAAEAPKPPETTVSHAFAPVITVTAPLSAAPPLTPQAVADSCRPHVDVLPALASRAIDLLTRAYEHYKTLGRTRWTVWLAGRIARVYGGWEGLLTVEGQGLNTAMAAKFWERVGKSYRGGWDKVLGDIVTRRVSAGFSALEVAGSDRKRAWTGIFEGLIEGLVVVGGQAWDGELRSASDRWRADESTDGDLVLDMDSLSPFATPTFSFQIHASHIPTPVPFQLALGVSTNLCSSWAFDRIVIRYSDPNYNLEIEHLPSDRAPRNVDIVDVSAASRTTAGARWTVSGDLSLVPGALKVFQGAVVPETTGDLRAVGVDLVWASSSTRTVRLAYKFPDSRTLVSPDRERVKFADPLVASAVSAFKRRWVTLDKSTGKAKVVVLESAGEPPLVRITRRQPVIGVQVSHPSPAFLNEIYPLTVAIRNDEAATVHLFLSGHVSLADATAPPEGIPSIAHPGHGHHHGPRKHHHDVGLDSYFVDELGREFDASVYGAPAPMILGGEAVMSPTAASSFTYAGGQFSANTGYIELGTLDPGASLVRKLHVRTERLSAERLVHITIYYRISDANDGRAALERSKTGSDGGGSVAINSAAEVANQEMYFRRTETIKLPVGAPFEARMSVRPAPSKGSMFCGVGGKEEPPVDDTEEGPGALGWDLRKRVQEDFLVSAGLRFSGPGEVEVDEVRLISDGWRGDAEVEPELEASRTFEILSDAASAIKSATPSGVAPVDRTGANGNGSAGTWKAGLPRNFLYLVRTFRDPSVPPENIQSIGAFRIRWRRKGSEAETGVWATTIVELPGITHDPEPVRVVSSEFITRPDVVFWLTNWLKPFPEPIARIPRQGIPFDFSFVVYNTSLSVQNIIISVARSDAFAFSGPMSGNVKLLPLSTHRLDFALYPLRSGEVRLPRLKVVVIDPNAVDTPSQPIGLLPPVPPSGRPSMGSALEAAVGRASTASPEPTSRPSLSAESRSSISIGEQGTAASVQAKPPAGREVAVQGQTADEGLAVFVLPNLAAA